MDPYVYPNSNILINKLNIQDEQTLINVEAQLLIAGILDIPTILNDIDFSQLESVQTIHRFLFEELYAWAGEFRKINIYKSERVLGGLSVPYSDYQNIPAEMEKTFKWTHSIVWNPNNKDLAHHFSKFMTDLWRIHPYREGNTRAVSIFMKLFAEKYDIPFNARLLSENAGYLRNALVLAAVPEAPEPQHLFTIISDALGLIDKPIQPKILGQSTKYKAIGQYEVINYEEKPFKTTSEDE